MENPSSRGVIPYFPHDGKRPIVKDSSLQIDSLPRSVKPLYNCSHQIEAPCEIGDADLIEDQFVALKVLAKELEGAYESLVSRKLKI